MRQQQIDKIQKQIDALEASIETVTWQIKQLARLVSSAQLYTWRKHKKNLRHRLMLKRHDLKLLSPTIPQTKTKRNAHA